MHQTPTQKSPLARFALAAPALAMCMLLTACTSLPLPDATRRELAPTGTLRAAINYNNPLLATRDPATGELRGLAVDLSRELARRAGVPVQLLPYEAAGKITGSAKENVWDVGFLAVDPLRANEIEFSAPHVELEGTYLVPAGSPLQAIADVDRDGVRIAVTAGSAYDLFLTRELKHAQLVHADNTPRSLEMMREQRLDAVAAVRTALVAAAKTQPGSRVLDGHFMTIPQAMGVPKGRTAAARYVSRFVEEMKESGFVARSLRSHGLGPDDAIVARSDLPYVDRARMLGRSVSATKERRKALAHPARSTEKARRRNAQKNRRKRERVKSMPSPRSGVPWTADEDAIICRDDLTGYQQALMLGRSYWAIKARRRQLRTAAA